MEKKSNLWIVMLIIVLTMACGSFGTKTETENAAVDNKTQNTTVENTEKTENDGEKKEEEFTGEVKFPFDFPTAGTTAKAGEKVLVPSYNWVVDAMQKDPKKMTMIWYQQEMVAPGDEMSEIKFINRKTEKIPNAYIIPLAAGQTAKKGDILLTTWSISMNRAIVTNAADPKTPTVRYLDLSYDNPAKSRDGKTTIGQMDEQIKPDSFVVIKNELEPGTSVMIGSEMKHGQVIRVEGDKVFVRLFAGRVDVFPKSDITAVPIRPNVKAGDKVKAEYIGRFKDGTVSKVDESIGRVWVKFENVSEDKVIAFGDVMPN